MDWWKQDEKSLVREMMSGRVINIPGTEVKTFADDTSATDISIDQLMGRHSELLKDFQVGNKSELLLPELAIKISL